MNQLQKSFKKQKLSELYARLLALYVFCCAYFIPPQPWTLNLTVIFRI